VRDCRWKFGIMTLRRGRVNKNRAQPGEPLLGIRDARSRFTSASLLATLFNSPKNPPDFCPSPDNCLTAARKSSRNYRTR